MTILLIWLFPSWQNENVIYNPDPLVNWQFKKSPFGIFFFDRSNFVGPILPFGTYGVKIVLKATKGILIEERVRKWSRIVENILKYFDLSRTLLALC